MARGILGGMVFGGLVSLGAAGVISVVLDPPTRPEAAVTAPEVAEAPTDTALQEEEARVEDADVVRDDAAPQVTAPEPDEAVSADAAGGDAPTVPETDASAPAFIASAPPDATNVDTDPDEPVLPTPQATLPDAPAAETDLSIATEPAQPPKPEEETLTTSVDLPQPAVPKMPVSELEIEAPALGASEIASAPKPQVEIAVLPQVAPPQVSVPVVEPESVAPESEPESITEEAPADEIVGATETPVEAEPEAPQDTPEATVDATEERPTNEDVIERVAIGRPATSLIGRNTEEPQTEAEVVETEPVVTAGPPLELYATPFDNPEQKPLMSVVLIDDGVSTAEQESGLAALKDFPFALTFAVDVYAADARDKMRLYRDAGYEVLALMDLPEQASAVDAEINLAAALDVMPEVIGLMEGTGTGLQGSREAAEQLVTALSETGHGFVLQSKGLNTLEQLAARDGVPARVVFRDFDSAGQTARVIRRFLDQAAFRAGQEGGVIMLGRLRSETISALLLWGFQDRAQRVALAPVSAILTQ